MNFEENIFEFLIFLWASNGKASDIMNEIFRLREKSHYNLRYTTEFIIPPIHSVYHGRESAFYLGPKL